MRIILERELDGKNMRATVVDDRGWGMQPEKLPDSSTPAEDVHPRADEMSATFLIKLFKWLGFKVVDAS